MNPSDIPKKSIGHYVFGKTLGEGTFGKVKLGTHVLTGEKVAIKILEKQKIVDASDVERVTREIQILKILRHPHLIQLYEIIETPRQLFLVMEYVSGGELFDYIVQNQRIKDIEAARIFSQIISGVEYIHRLKIVHRDMKPENLLLEPKGRIKIVDFGLSNTYKQEEQLKTACGSPCYAAPEMIAGKRYNGLQVDIWSCGVILFAMLAGYLPFEDPNTSALYKKILSGDYKIPKFVSNEGKDLIAKILNTDPQKRYTIQDIRRHPFMNLFKQQKIPQGIIVGQNVIPVDEEIARSLQQFGIQLDYAIKCIEANRHNHITTTYYLLLKKLLTNGGKSCADIGADSFDPQQIEVRRETLRSQNTANMNEDRPTRRQMNPLPTLQMARKPRLQPQDESPVNIRQASRQQHSVDTQSTMPISPKLQHSADVTRRFIDNNKFAVEKQTLPYRISLDPTEQRYMKLKTPVNRQRIISDYQGKMPRRIILNNEIRGKSTDMTDDAKLSRTFYRASPNYAKLNDKL